MFFYSSGFFPMVSAASGQAVRNHRRWVPDEIIVKFEEGLSDKALSDINLRYGGRIAYSSRAGRFHRIKIPQGLTAEQTVEMYRSEPGVEYAELNYYARALFTPDDPMYYLQWNLHEPLCGINIERAWDVTRGEPNVIVAVIDTGVAYEDYSAPAHWHIDTYRAYGDSGHSWWCGLDDPAWSRPPGYGNGWKDYLRHSFDLAGAHGTITLSYWYRHDLENDYDFCYVEASVNGGESWTILKTYTGKSTTTGLQVRWKQDSIDLSSYAGEGLSIRFRVYSDDSASDQDGDYNSDGAFFIDEIELTDAEGLIFYDNVESGPGNWETTRYKQAPDLEGTLFVPGYDFVNDDNHPNDDEGHGTHVTGTIAQTTDNGVGVAGIAHRTAVMPLKVLDSTGSGTYQQIADAIYYAADNGASVINMSLGGEIPSLTLQNAVAYAYNHGVVIIAAAGNSYQEGNLPLYPAAYDDYCIAVGATTHNCTRAFYSNTGSYLDLAAPGGDSGGAILQQTFANTPVDFGYLGGMGTSMAAPHVSGVAALLVSIGVTIPDDVRQAMQNTARDLGTAGWDAQFGWGLVDAWAALNYFHTPGDFNYDGSVNFKDLEKLADCWLGYDPLVDVAPGSGDGIVDFLDFSVMAGSWE